MNALAMTPTAARDGDRLMTAMVKRDRRPAILMRSALLGSILAAGLAGCTANRTEIVGAIPDDYRVNHPIVLANQLKTLDIPVANEAPALGRGMASNIAAFGDAFLAGGGTVLAIVVPSGSQNARAAAYLAGQVRRVLVEAGVPAQAIDTRGYAAQPGETEAPLRLAYDTIAAQTAPCGPWPENVATNTQNTNYANFGCATQTNLAAMVSNPLDLLYPRRRAPIDATRRGYVLEGYRIGDVFQGNYSREPNFSAADVGN